MINKDKLKGFIAGVCVTLVISSGAVFADSISKSVTAVYNNIKIVIDGKEITPKDANGNTVEPFIIDGTTYLPVRAIGEAFGKEVTWDGSSNTVYIGKKAEREFYRAEPSTLEPFSEKALFNVGGESINGGILNFYVIQDATDHNLRQFSDNFSPAGTLQTIMIDGISAAKFIVDNAVNDIKLIYAGCSEAEKSGYANKEEVKKEVESLYAGFMLNFSNAEELDEYCKSLCISAADLETFAKKSFLFESYINSIYTENLSRETDVKKIEEEIRNTYITAKHILVEDEALAKEIIKKIEKGEDFNTLMKEHNTDPGATAEGYTFTKGEMVEPFETAAFALSENTYTKTPVKTSYGYHIIYRMPFNEEYIKEAVSLYKEKEAQNITTEYVENLKKNAVVTFTPDYETYITTIK